MIERSCNGNSGVDLDACHQLNFCAIAMFGKEGYRRSVTENIDMEA